MIRLALKRRLESFSDEGTSEQRLWGRAIGKWFQALGCPEGGRMLWTEGSQAAQSALTSLLDPCRWPTSSTSPLEHPLKSSKSSLTPAHLTCGFPPSTAKVPPAVSTSPPPILSSLSNPPTPSLAPDRYSSLVSAGKHFRYNPKASSSFQSGDGKHINLRYGCGRITGVLATDTVRVTWEPGPQSGLVLGATNACKIDAAGRDCLSENPLVAGHPPSRALSLGRQLPCWHTNSQNNEPQRGAWGVDLHLHYPMFILLEQEEGAIKHPLLYSQALQGTFMVITCSILQHPQAGDTIISSG